MNAWIGLMASLCLAGCAATTPSDESDDVIEVAFNCDRGEQVTVQFHPSRELAVLIRNGEHIELPQQRSGSGFIYGNGPNTIRGKGDELTLEIGRMVPIQCKAVP